MPNNDDMRRISTTQASNTYKVHFEWLEAVEKLKSDFLDFDQHLEKSKSFENFYFKKVRFPDPKSRSDCFPHLRNEVSFAPGSREMFLDSYKVHFGWLEAVVMLKSEYLRIQPSMYLSTDFPPPRR